MRGEPSSPITSPADPFPFRQRSILNSSTGRIQKAPILTAHSLSYKTVRRFCHASAERTEREHITLVPDGEREEIRQLFRAKGFEGALLEDVVDTLSSNKEVWIKTMLREEYGLSTEGLSPLRAAITTFVSFMVVGTVPLIPYLLPGLETIQQFLASLGLAALVFLGIGMLKSAVYRQPVWRSGVRTLLIGTAAAGLAFATGYLVEGLMAGS
ncbi:MAG: VIT1/CCC1 transporter family protein [Saccharospirillum sp.]|uniref:VIT1/CCC1 transporter family protein n=1 Tax=Saccharospirillum sp. TaxID=2033801 RepID=UPI003299EF36